uniref:Myomaker, myoblast fusion factor n=1 Tax=Oncorhynchus kisutch TaxID=8019 RepID=A0A8C7H2V0_ONCKI
CNTMIYHDLPGYTMIHHACDGPGLSIICFIKCPGVLHCVRNNHLYLGHTDSFHVWGVDLCCGINQDHGIYSGPIGSAVFIITVRVLQKMKGIKDLYQRRVYTQLVGPGCCVGLHKWEYAYVHSFYHLSMAVSFVLLLPKMNRYAGTDVPAKLSYIMCCKRQ